MRRCRRSGKKGGRTVVESLDGSKLVVVLDHEVAELVEQGGTGSTWRMETPCGVESLVGGDDCTVDIGGGSLVDGGDDLAVGCVGDERRSARRGGVGDGLGLMTLREIRA